MAKKRNVPEVLWRLFQNRARTLGDTIVALLSTHSPSVVVECCCKNSTSRCLGCSGKDPMSFLLREQDSSDYRKLLNQCFVVVSDNAPPLSCLSPARHWSHLEIVRRTLEMILREQPQATNVICNGYDKDTSSSAVVEVLTSAAWSLLLRRVGDDLMVYLLKYTSIFLPLPHKKHHQVTGLPISNLCTKFSKCTSEFNYQHSSRDLGGGLQIQGSQRKRKRTHEVDSTSKKQQHGSSSFVDIPLSSKCVVANRGKHLRPFLWRRKKKMAFQCSCCSVLQTFQKVAKEVQINRQSMFYKLEHASSIFPQKHILNSLKPNISGANALFKDMFGLVEDIISQPMICPHSDDCGRIKTSCLYHSLLKLLKILIRKARLCPHLRLLHKHCPISSHDQNANEGRGSMFEHTGAKIEGTALLKEYNGANGKTQEGTSEATAHPFQSNNSYCTKQQVVSFIWAVCRNIIPPNLLGTPSNWRTLRRNISKFIWLRRFEKFSLEQCMDKLKTSEFSFLSDKHCCEINDGTKQKLLEKWIFWFFSCLVVPLVQANFYATETENGKQEVFFYHKSVWKKLKNESISCLQNECYGLLNYTSAEEIVSKRRFGFSRVRLLPKANGMRPLANLRASSEMFMRKRNQFKRFKPVNLVLRDLHVVLKDVQLKRPKKLGASVFDYNDIYRKLRPFLSLLKSESGTMNGVFIVVADVVKAFDSIAQDKLFSVMKDILTDDYCLKYSKQVVCRKQFLHVHQNRIVADPDISNLSTAFSSSVGTRSSHAILVNQYWSKTVKRKDLHDDLNEHVKNNVLQIDKRFYLQNVGIPQGSILSSLLCSFYYGHLENSIIFPFLEKALEAGCGDKNVLSSPPYMLLRFIDDFIFISTSKKQAEKIFWRLRRGFREYNCYMSEEKFGLNFDVDQILCLKSNRKYIAEDGNTFLPWCGLFINCNTLEVQADYTRYLDTHISSTLTVCWKAQNLKAKLCDYMRPKCHPIFYDSNINSTVVVRLNIYQAFLICAMKFHCYIRNLSHTCRLDAKSYLNIIHKSLRYMYKLIKKRMYSMDIDSNFCPVLQVEKGEVEWLGFTAYIRVLKQKQSRYKELLSLLKLKSMSLYGENVSLVLKDAVEDSHSSVLWKIKY